MIIGPKGDKNFAKIGAILNTDQQKNMARGRPGR